MLNEDYERFILVSESCIPLFNFSFVHGYIMRSKHSFIGAFDDHGPYGRGRYNENMAPEVNITSRRQGSQWFEVNRKLAVSMVEDTTYYPKFEEFCRPHCYVDEHYFPHHVDHSSSSTPGWTSQGVGLTQLATFGRADTKEELFKTIREDKRCIYNNQSASICYLFARKFAPSALEPLLHILSRNSWGF